MNWLGYAPLLFNGALITLSAWICAGCISVAVGGVIGFFISDLYSNTVSKKILNSYVFIARGIPLYLHILLFYYALPALLLIPIKPFFAATAALAFCSSGYIAEIIRGGFNAIDYGQWQAAFVLGYSRVQALRRIIVPQVLKIVFPALFGEIEQLLKSTSMLSAIGLLEITRVGLNIISRELNPIPVYCSVATIYLVFSFILGRIHSVFEERMHYGER